MTVVDVYLLSTRRNRRQIQGLIEINIVLEISH